MKRLKTVLFALILPIVTIGGCATGYEKEGVFHNGYSDFHLSDNTFVVTFRANEHTPVAQVFEYALRRATEIARKQGYRYFTVIDQVNSGKHLHYPSLRLTIQCHHTPPEGAECIDVHTSPFSS